MSEHNLRIISKTGCSYFGVCPDKKKHPQQSQRVFGIVCFFFVGYHFVHFRERSRIKGMITGSVVMYPKRCLPKGPMDGHNAPDARPLGAGSGPKKRCFFVESMIFCPNQNHLSQQALRQSI